jgi:hypothetical protein
VRNQSPGKDKKPEKRKEKKRKEKRGEIKIASFPAYLSYAIQC